MWHFSRFCTNLSWSAAFFLIYVHGMYRSSKKVDFYLFADDTNLLYAEKDLTKLETVINDELLKLCEWLNSNNLLTLVNLTLLSFILININ